PSLTAEREYGLDPPVEGVAGRPLLQAEDQPHPPHAYGLEGPTAGPPNPDRRRPRGHTHAAGPLLHHRAAQAAGSERHVRAARLLPTLPRPPAPRRGAF